MNAQHTVSFTQNKRLLWTGNDKLFSEKFMNREFSRRVVSIRSGKVWRRGLTGNLCYFRGSPGAKVAAQMTRT